MAQKCLRVFLYFKIEKLFLRIKLVASCILLYELDKNTSNLKMLKSKVYILTYLCLGVVFFECVWLKQLRTTRRNHRKENKPRRVLFSNMYTKAFIVVVVVVGDYYMMMLRMLNVLCFEDNLIIYLFREESTRCMRFHTFHVHTC